MYKVLKGNRLKDLKLMLTTVIIVMNLSLNCTAGLTCCMDDSMNVESDHRPLWELLLCISENFMNSFENYIRVSGSQVCSSAAGNRNHANLCLNTMTNTVDYRGMFLPMHLFNTSQVRTQ